MVAMKALPAILVLLLSLCTRADVFLLADGSRVEGVSSENGEQVTIAAFDGRTIHVSKKEIRASTSEPKRNAYFTRLKKLGEKDADGRVELALFCRKNKLTREADELLHDALKIDPANTIAGRELGYELIEGKWRPAEDPNFQIGVRPQPKKMEASSEQAQALLKRIAALKLDAKQLLAQAPEAAELISDCRDDPAALIRLMLPPQFPGGLSKVSVEVRARGAALAGLTQDRRLMQALMDAAVYDPEEAVRFSAAKALPQLEEPVAIRRLMDLAISTDSQKHPWVLRKSACIALRRYGSQEILERLLKELSFELAGGNQRDSKNRLRGKGTGIGTDNPLGVQDAIQPDYGAPETELYPVLSAVKEITGQTFDKNEKDMKTWIAWWKADGGKFEFKD